MENTDRMVALDDAWNAQDVDEVAKYHKPDVIVYWPGQPPTRGMGDHRTEARAFFTTIPDQHLENRPYKVLFGAGDWTCSMARFTGTMKGPMGDTPATGKSFDVDFCTVAHWDNGQISEEYLFYDLVTFMKQIGLSE